MKKTLLVKVKVKLVLGQAMKAWSGIGGTAVHWWYSCALVVQLCIGGTAVHFLFNVGARWVGWSTPPPGGLTLWKETWYPFYRRVGG
jgi:hypothetical protein